MRDCNKVKNVSTVTRLCPGCEKVVNGSQADRREDNQTRQNQSRSKALDQQRDLNISLTPSLSPSETPPSNNLINFPNASMQSNTGSTSAPQVMDPRLML